MRTNNCEFWLKDLEFNLWQGDVGENAGRCDSLGWMTLIACKSGVWSSLCLFALVINIKLSFNYYFYNFLWSFKSYCFPSCSYICTMAEVGIFSYALFSEVELIIFLLLFNWRIKDSLHCVQPWLTSTYFNIYCRKIGCSYRQIILR